MKRIELLLAMNRNAWSRNGLADLLQVNRRTVYRWIAGESAIPEMAALAIECLERRAATYQPLGTRLLQEYARATAGEK